MKPVLLLIPGMLNTAGVWSDVAERLQGSADVRIAEVRMQTSIAAMAADAWARVNDMPGDTPLAVCGFSMGGYVAMEMLACPARRMGALALLGTSARVETDASLARRQATIAAMARDFDRAVDGILAAATHPSTQADAVLMARLRAVMTAVGAEAGARQIRAIIGRADRRAELARLDIPVLVACGRDDRITPPDASEELAALIPGAQLESIAQAGHMAPLEQPGRVADLLRALLGELAIRHPIADRTTTKDTHEST